MPASPGRGLFEKYPRPGLAGLRGLEKGESPPAAPCSAVTAEQGARAEGEKMGNGCRAGADIVEERMKKGKNYEEIEETI